MYKNRYQSVTPNYFDNRRTLFHLIACLVVILLAAQGAFFTTSAAKIIGPPPPAQHQIKVMTRNVYHGVNAEIFAIPGAPLSALPGLVTEVYVGYQERKFPERSQELAAEIEATHPDVIGLQEAVLVRTGTLQNPTQAVNVAFDYVQILLDTLDARGLHYAVAAELHIFDISLPSSLGYYIRHTDREVILARTDLPPGHFAFSNPQSGYFSVNCQLPSSVGLIPIKRGWVSVDVWTRGREYRFISTHLDGDCLPYFPSIQIAQAQQIVNGPANTSLPVVLAGDINASPLSPVPSAYQVFVDNSFLDAWQSEGAGDGFTCCQADDLLNPVSNLDTRIDVILYRGDLESRSVQLLGDNPAFRTPSGLWPSDHAGLQATFGLGNP